MLRYVALACCDRLAGALRDLPAAIISMHVPTARMVNELFLLLLRNFGITYLRILNLQTQLMVLSANLKHFFLRELMHRDVFNSCYYC